jgi:hypothetical protein
MELSGQFHAASTAHLERFSCTQYIGACLGFKVSLEAVDKRKISAIPGIEPNIVNILTELSQQHAKQMNILLTCPHTHTHSYIRCNIANALSSFIAYHRPRFAVA